MRYWNGRVDQYGYTYGFDVPTDVDVASMTSPVRCLRCYRGVYDLGTITVTARYLDCSVWRTPCCGVEVDSRGASGGWGTRADYEHVQVDCRTFRYEEENDDGV